MTPLTSIVILTRNQLEYTRQCVDSIRARTPEPIELIFVDNGSTDGTLEYLRALPESFVIENGRNLGFGGGCNQGMGVARGERILLLNNDVIVTDGWLAALHRELDLHPATGITGPRSNRIIGSQQVDDVCYDEEHPGEDLVAWSRSWCAEHAGQSRTIMRAVGFCMLIERAVIEQIGGFDLRFGLGNFEDDDICLRAQVAGFEIRIVEDSFVHHFGSRTFAGEQIDYRVSMGENHARFAAKWQMRESEVDAATGGYRAGQIVARTTFDPARHYAPLVGAPDDDAIAQIDGHRSTVLLACCDRSDATTTATTLHTLLVALGPTDDITLVIRVDPRDELAYSLLDDVAEHVGEHALPDVVIIESPDENDTAVLRAADAVFIAGRHGAARAGLGRHVDVLPVDAVSLDDFLTRIRTLA